jgi:hypothetical protein
MFHVILAFLVPVAFWFIIDRCGDGVKKFFQVQDCPKDKSKKE